jgi:hypothetical protein
MNLAKRRLSSVEREIVAKGRAALLRAWADSPYSDGQGDDFAVTFVDECVDNTGTLDRFRAHHAAKRISPAWARQADAHAFIIEHSSSAFYIYVPHAYYFGAERLPLWCPCACLADTLPPVVVAALLAALAYVVLGA